MICIKYSDNDWRKIWLLNRNETLDLYDKPFSSNEPPAEYFHVSYQEMSAIRHMQKENVPMDLFVCCPSPDILVEFEWRRATIQIQAHMMKPKEISKLIDNKINVTIGYFDISINENDTWKGFTVPIIINVSSEGVQVRSNCMGILDDNIDKIHEENHFPIEPIMIEDDMLLQSLIRFDMIRMYAIEYWRRVQYALSHPNIVKSIHRENSSEDVSYSTNWHGVRARKKVCGIKRIYMNDAIKTETKKHYGRHTSAWYVEGHFRVNKEGEYSWVSGYWKGPDKDKIHPTRNIEIVNDNI